jgi:hypothetical protein
MCQWDINFMGYFRSIAEAQAYTAARLDMTAATEEPTEEKTEAPETEAPETNAPETNAPEQGGDATQAPDGEQTTAPAKEGCGSVIGFSAIAILAAAAAAVALKKD